MDAAHPFNLPSSLELAFKSHPVAVDLLDKFSGFDVLVFKSNIALGFQSDNDVAFLHFWWAWVSEVVLFQNGARFKS